MKENDIKILFTSTCKQVSPFIDDFVPTDQMAFRLTRDQGIFTLSPHTHVYPLHILAQNISLPSTVLEYPTVEQFTNELTNSYDYVCISFMTYNIDCLQTMCKIIRQQSPITKIIVGGYGTICTPIFRQDAQWEGLIDYNCRGEGISFIRDLLGDSTNEPIKCQLPKVGSVLPWLKSERTGTTAALLSGLGCTYKCPFCSTSEYTNGNYIEILDYTDMYNVIRAYYDNNPCLDSVVVYDENFLEHEEKFRKLSTLIQNDNVYGLRKINYVTFSSISALSKYEPEELLLSGLSSLWVGVESKFTNLKKRKGLSPQEAFNLLHSIGISTTGSWMIGDEQQTPDNIQEDVDYFVSLNPTFQQLSIMSVVPATRLWKQLKEKGRIPDDVPWSSIHLYGNTYRHKLFSYEAMLQIVDKAYKRIYNENGASVVKLLDININGYETCRKSKNRLLNRDRFVFYANLCHDSFPILKTAMEYAPSAKVKKTVEEIARRYRDNFGKEKVLSHQKTSDEILLLADAEVKKREKRPYRSVDEPFRRYAYSHFESRPSRCPYTVEYPETNC